MINSVAGLGGVRHGQEVFAKEVRPSLRLAAPDDSPVAPLRGLFYTAADIRHVRQVVEHDAAMREKAERFLRQAEAWMSRDPAFFKKICPAPDAKFAYGFAGDPKTNQSWPWYGRAENMCSLDRPGQVRSPRTGEVYGIQKPGEKYYDPGDGWVRPDDGKRFYFKGIWNAYAERQLDTAVSQLAMAYMLTGDERLAERAMYILDLLATLRAKRPNDRGPVDWPKKEPLGKGYFSYMGTIANERMVITAQAVDLLGRTSAASRPSSFDPSITRLENIKTHYFQVFEPWRVRHHDSLQNHVLIALCNITAQGILFGEPKKVRAGIEGAYGFLNNCFHRDGSYYEVSGKYAQFGRLFGSQLISLLTNYDPANYENPGLMPQPKDYPHDLKLGNDPRWYAQMTTMNVRTLIDGRRPQYGDTRVDRDVLHDDGMDAITARRLGWYLRLAYRQVTRPNWKKHIAQLYWQLPQVARRVRAAQTYQIYGPSQWDQPPRPKPMGTDLSHRPSDFMPSKQMAVLRSGRGEDRRALLMRGGANAVHAHDDQMAVVLYARGMMVSGEYGYRLWGTPDHLGWGSRAISHQMVVVNQDLPPQRLYKGDSHFAPAANLDALSTHPPVQLVEMDNADIWRSVAPNMKDYRRTLWLIDVSPADFYVLDMFDVIGGRTHDDAYHSPYLDPPQPDDGFAIEGVTPEAVRGCWTLASLTGKNRDAAWNQPGRSWGERLLGTAGAIKGVHQKNWNPPPGNGYGFIYNVKAARTTGDWSATWDLIDGKHQKKLSMVNFDGMTVVTGREPGIEIGSRQAVVVGRRQAAGKEPLHSRFAGVIQVAAQKDWPVRSVVRVPIEARSPADVMAVRMRLKRGRQDLAVVSRTPQTVAGKGWRLVGRRGFVRQDKVGRVEVMVMNQATSLQYGPWRIAVAESDRQAAVAAVEPGDQADHITLSQAWPTGTRLAGVTLLLNSNRDAAVPYTHHVYYKVETIEHDDQGRAVLVFEKQRTVAGRIQVASVDRKARQIETLWPDELIGGLHSGYFRGKAVAVAGEAQPVTTIEKYLDFKKIRLAEVKDIHVGDKLNIMAVQPGDTADIPSDVMLRRVGEGRYELKANEDVTLDLPLPPGAKLMLLSQGSTPQVLAVAAPDGPTRVTITLDQMQDGAAVLQVAQEPLK